MCNCSLYIIISSGASNPSLIVLPWVGKTSAVCAALRLPILPEPTIRAPHRRLFENPLSNDDVERLDTNMTADFMVANLLYLHDRSLRSRTQRSPPRLTPTVKNSYCFSASAAGAPEIGVRAFALRNRMPPISGTLSLHPNLTTGQTSTRSGPGLSPAYCLALDHSYSMAASASPRLTGFA